MNYELAKELKEAGFPQNPDNRELHTEKCGGWENPDPECRIDTRPRVPTLEELIEACKPYLRQITFHSDGTVDAKCGAKSPFPNRIYSSRTLDHALSKMWIALNAKA